MDKIPCLLEFTFFWEDNNTHISPKKTEAMMKIKHNDMTEMVGGAEIL